MGNKLEKLKEQRKKRKLSQEQMAKRLKISKYTYKAYEQGTRKIKAETLKEISIILKCTISKLI